MNAILTRTEDKIVRLMMHGFQRKEIASQMKRSPDTVSVHFRNIHTKTNVQSEIELYTWYLENILEINIKKMLQVIACLILVIFAELSQNTEMRRAKTRSSAKVETALMRAKTRSKSKELLTA